MSKNNVWTVVQACQGDIGELESPRKDSMTTKTVTVFLNSLKKSKEIPVKFRESFFRELV